MKKTMPGAVAHSLSAVMTFLLVVCLLACGCTSLLNVVLNDADLHESIAQNEAVVDAQMTRIRQDVTALSEKYPFDVETVMTLVSRESVQQYGHDVTAWWMGLVKESPELIAPTWQCDTLEETIRADETFKEAIPSGQQKSVARDKVASGIVSSIDSAVLPLRSELISFGLSRVPGSVNVPKLAAYVPYLPWICLLVSLILCGILTLLMYKRPIKALLYIGSALGASGLVAGVLLVLVGCLDLPGMVGSVSALLCMQAELLMSQLMLWSWLTVGICLVLGLVMIGLHQRSMTKLCRKEAAGEVA